MTNITTISRVVWSTIILIHLALFLLAIFSLTQAQSLHLPIPSAVLVLSTLVPILPVLSILLPALTSTLRSRSKNHTSGPTLTTYTEQPHRITPLARPVIAILALVDVSLVASAAVTLNPLSLNCSLSTTWNALFSAKNAVAIRTIQEALACCGFQTPQHQAYPFPDRNHGTDACITAYDTHVACQPLLLRQTRRTVGSFVAVGVFALAVKAVLTLFTTRNAGVRDDGRPAWKGKSPRALLSRDVDAEEQDDRDEENEDSNQRSVDDGVGAA